MPGIGTPDAEAVAECEEPEIGDPGIAAGPEVPPAFERVLVISAE